MAATSVLTPTKSTGSCYPFKHNKGSRQTLAAAYLLPNLTGCVTPGSVAFYTSEYQLLDLKSK